MTQLTIDYTNMLAPALDGHGLPSDVLAASAGHFARVHENVAQRRASGQLGFYDLPYASALIDDIERFAEKEGQAFAAVVVLGIGGSALGALALKQALAKPDWNSLDDAGRDYFPRLHVLDNIDPSTIGPLLDRIDVRRALFNVISKSGATAETMAQYLIVRERLGLSFPDDGYRAHLLFTTDPKQGVLRELADLEGIATLPIPPNVGGRFSVLSAVGLLPAALIGIDIRALLQGARDMDERCRAPALLDNPAGMFAMLQFLAHTRAGAHLHVMMPYSDRLYLTADWFRQLWAESLGKRVDLDGRQVCVGPTPIKALGATDQHSQLQLYMEGPFDKTITLLAVESFPIDVAIPNLYPEIEGLSYLGGHTLGELLEAERNATAMALARHGRMNLTIRLPTLNAHALGQLLMMLQIATVYAGVLYNVDPLDQPGVELGKQLTYALMGRSGFEPPRPDEQGVEHVVR
ncbi:MAG: glucose-6-phosphate isomerase [Longimicrobiales bacterium]